MLSKASVWGFILAAVLTGPAYSQEQGAPPTVAPAAPSVTPTAGDSKPARVKVGGKVEQATLIHMVQPVYPKEAKEAHISGTVVVRGVIAKDGSLQQVEYVSGPEELKQAAIDAVTQWRYKPTTLAGNPVEVDTTIELVFSLDTPVQAQGEEPPATPPSTGQSPTPATASPSPRPMRIRIGGSVQSPALVHVVEPEYPEGSKVTGTVVLHAIIATDGTVMSLDHLSGDPLLTLAATEAVKQWRYTPILLNGRPVQVDTTISVVFALDEMGNLKPQPKPR